MPGDAGVRLDGEDGARDADLVAAARDGDRAALGELIGRHEAMVLRVLRLLGVSTADREDVAQDVFLRVLRFVRGFRRGHSFPGWVYRITVNAAHDHRARAGRRRRDETGWHDGLLEAADAAPGPARIAEDRDRVRRLERAVTGLSERERAVFVLVELEGLSTLDVARALGITRITVRRHLGRARDRLERLLSEGEAEKKSALD